MSCVLITGGAGFIGSMLARRMLSEGRTVLIVDDLSTGRRENVPPEAIFFLHDIRNPLPEKIAEYPVETVFHLAAQTSGENSFYIPLADVEINVGGTVRLLEWAGKHKAHRFVHMSSMSVYGDQRADSVGEDVTPTPNSIYGSTKLCGEFIVKALSKQYGLEPTSIRLFSCYGPGQNLDNLKQGIVSIYLAHLLREKRILVKGSLDRLRDLIHVDDVVEAMVRLERCPASHWNVMNLGTGHPTTISEMTDWLRQAAGMPDAPIQHGDPTPGDVRGFVANIARLESILKWRPKINSSDGIAGMVRSYTKPEKS